MENSYFLLKHIELYCGLFIESSTFIILHFFSQEHTFMFF